MSDDAGRSDVLGLAQLRRGVSARPASGGTEAAQMLVERGASPVLFRRRLAPRRDAVAEAEHRGARRILHSPAVARNPLPRDVGAMYELPDDGGSWGFLFRDVPERASGATSLLNFEGVHLVSARAPDGRRD